jgi:hypothetical protein
MAKVKIGLIENRFVTNPKSNPKMLRDRMRSRMAACAVQASA